MDVMTDNAIDDAPYLSAGEQFNEDSPPPSATLKSHFDVAVDILGRKAEIAANLAEWRQRARDDGLEPAVIFSLARKHLQDANQRRKAAERAELEELYRQGIGLPLFDCGRGA
jgi:hypothetical protein